MGPRLDQALAVPEETGYALTHAFHPYPGRFHPALPRALFNALSEPGAAVLDPFMGGGTVLVEAMLQGLAAVGNDLNPVALLVARERTRPRTPAQARRVEAQARRIAAEVEGLRREKNPPRYEMRHHRRIATRYAPHLLAEMMQWLRLIQVLGGGDARDTLRAVFSAAAVKFSNLASDSRPEAGTPPRYPKGAASRFLVDKCDELLRAQVELGRRLPPGTPPVRLLEEDARLLPSLGWDAVPLVVTSPPYPGVYDYHAQHRLRMDWLGLEGAGLEAGEIAPRRQSGATGAEGGWSANLRDVLGTLARVVRPGGRLALVVGDWISEGHAVDAAAVIGRPAVQKGWTLEARASHRRTVHTRTEKKAFARKGKWEHLLLFQLGGRDAARNQVSRPGRPS